jgi:hypothetical protein
MTKNSSQTLRSLFLAGFLACFAFLPSATASDFTVTPSSLNFGNQSILVASASQTVQVINNSSHYITLSSFTLSPSAQFQLRAGFAPFQILAHQSQNFEIAFAPGAAQAYSGSLTINLAGYAPAVVPLTGTGFAPTASVSVSSSTIDFGNQTEGTVSAAKTVTITNSGTGALTVTAVNESSSFFNVKGFTTSIVLTAGQSLPLTVTFNPSATVSYTGTLDISYDVLADSGVALSGTGTAPGSLGVTNMQTLPAAIQGAAYLATLVAAQGTPPYSWQLAAGSSLPNGLSLSAAGGISGTLSSSVGSGSYQFTVQVSDSAKLPASATAQLNVPVIPPTGANCNEVSVDVAGTSTPLTAITDLGTGTYLGAEGGLYPSGSNVRPPGQDAAGVALAQQIGPLDPYGKPNPTGEYGMITLGISITHDIGQTFVSLADVDPGKNSKLVMVNGAQAGATVTYWADPTAPFWSTLINYFLPQAGLTQDQVVAVWDEDGEPASDEIGTFPNDISQLETDLKTVIQLVHTNFPNAKVMYLTSTPYTGYSIGVDGQEPEPHAYESGFAVQDLIAEQINGDPTLNYNPALGPVMAPWLSWGPYYWTNGLLGRNDGFVWDCQDNQHDGTHPSQTGQNKVADALLSFLKSDDTTVPWFLESQGPTVVLSPTSLTFASQNVGTTSTPQTITLTNDGNATLAISSITITGTNPGDFAETNSCGASVAVGANCTISVTFTPTATGTRTASVSVADNAAGSPQTATLTGTGIGGTPAVTLSPTSLTFPAQVVGTTSAPQVVTLTNTGNGMLDITSLSLTGTDSAEFSQTNTCGASVAAGGNCTVSVTFKPQHANAGNAALSISDNAPGSPQTVALTGIGTSVQLVPTSLSFASQTVGTTSPAQTVTLTSLLPKTTLTISGIAITGANAGDFAETNTCGSSVPPKGSCTISVTFTPATAGARTALLSIADNGGGSPQTVPLTGTGASNPAVTLSPASLSFSTQVVGTSSASQIVTLTNTGAGTLTISSISIGGNNPGDFAQTNTCGASVAAGGNCTISVTFTPTGKNSFSAAVSITDNASGSPQTVGLTGVGTFAKVAPVSLTFSGQPVGTTSPGQTVTLTNVAVSASMTISGITITGTDPDDFAQTNDCGSSLGARASCTINVTFTPKATGTRTASVSISDSGGASPQTIALSGTGT